MERKRNSNNVDFFRKRNNKKENLTVKKSADQSAKMVKLSKTKSVCSTNNVVEVSKFKSLKMTIPVLNMILELISG